MHTLLLPLFFVIAVCMPMCRLEGGANKPSPQYHGIPRYPDERQLNAKQYLLPANSPIKPELDLIFSNPNVLDNPKTFAAAGFKTLFFRARTSLRIATHPALPGYLFKLYLRSENNKNMPERQERLIRRAGEAARLEKFIKKNDIRRFTVPKKWLYKVQGTATKKSIYVLIAQFVNIVSNSQSEKAWKTKITYNDVRELNLLLREGYGSLAFSRNIPYTREGKFAFIDTEFPRREHSLGNVSKKLSPKMGRYWNKLLKSSERKRK